MIFSETQPTVYTTETWFRDKWALHLKICNFIPNLETQKYSFDTLVKMPDSFVLSCFALLYECSCPCLHANNHAENWQRAGRFGTGMVTRIVQKSRQRSLLFHILCSACQLYIRVGWVGLREYSALSNYVLQTLHWGQRPRVSPPNSTVFETTSPHKSGCRGGKHMGRKKEKSPSYLAWISKTLSDASFNFHT